MDGEMRQKAWLEPSVARMEAAPAPLAPRLADAAALHAESAAEIPDYLREVYSWAYLHPTFALLLDRQPVVEAILWGNARRLIARVLAEVQPGWRVLQPAAVYGTFSRQLAVALGPTGRLDVSDIAPLQVALTRRKLADLRQARVDLRDAASPPRSRYDAVTCFFLLHEVPDPMKSRIVAALLGAVRPGGKAVFVDYHRPRPAHLLRPFMDLIFARLEPFARALWHHAIADYAGPLGAGFDWRKETLFGDLYQVVVATRR